MAGLLLGGILAFWGQLATGAAACFSSVAPAPTEVPAATAPKDAPARRQIRIKGVPSQPN